MEEIFLSRAITSAEAKALLQSAMPSLIVFEWDMMKGKDAPPDLNPDVDTHIWFELDAESDSLPLFPCRLSIYNLPRERVEERQLWLGQMLSARYELTVWVSFTHPDRPTDPYYGIVFERGESYLADDSEVASGELNAKPVLILGPYPLPSMKFDSYGRFEGR
ncbi:hypothetical protein IC235_07670 [Hymenobacter sp. BT664]|uniref:Uncharacterized protein n=1 Tax=Hymenobacter montanus TaxID=2771359 RepID=A0A927GIS8_9BACT|nr:hypothetical protein [Hymenobacter montanus]MBD2767768.1 hypothetical protein [Hymenobacter montanus]